MIKINLLRDSSSSAGTSAGVMSSGGGSGGFSSSSGIVDGKDLLIKALLVLLPVVAYYGYDMQTVQTKKAKVEELRGQIAKTDKELAALDVQVKEVEKFMEEKRRLNSQLDTIKNLSKERLRNVKSMDALQSIMPQKAWLLEMSIKDTNVSLEGQAIDDIVISDFMRDLEESVFFNNVVLEASEEVRRDEGNVKKFRIRANLENL